MEIDGGRTASGQLRFYRDTYFHLTRAELTAADVPLSTQDTGCRGGGKEINGDDTPDGPGAVSVLF